MYSLSLRYRSLLAGLVLALAGLAGCRDYQPTTDPGLTPGPTTKTTVVGRVVDDNNRGVSGVAVTLHGLTTTSDADGVFSFVDATIPADRAIVQARASGYFTASRGFIPAANGSTVRLVLANRPLAGTVNSTSGGTVSVGNGAGVNIPANGVVRADGTPYSGTVRVMARAWQPGDADFNNCFPGDARARGTDGSTSLLVSLGFQNVELEDGSGNALKLASGSKATLSYTIPAAMQSAAPNRIPLWYFDESAGMWIEEGEAVRQGNTYTGQVSHFTPWNCDWRGGFGKICGTVKACGEDPASGVLVNVGPVQTTTDEYGNFCAEVAAGWNDPYEVYAVGAGNTDVLSNRVSVPTVARDQTVNVVLDMTQVAIVRGRLVDCDGKPTSGIVRVSWDGAIQNVLYIRDGNLSIGIPMGKEAIVSTSTHQITVPAQGACARYAMGDLQVCNNGQTKTDQIVDWSLTQDNGTPTVLQSGNLPGMAPGTVEFYGDSLNITAAGVVDGQSVGIFIHANASAPGTYKISVYAADPAYAILKGFGGDDLWATNGMDSLGTTTTSEITISKIDAATVEGSFTFGLFAYDRQKRTLVTVMGSFVGVRKP